MYVMLDMLLIIVITIIVFMIFSGFMSLLDSKVMAMTQNSMGPALFLFGLCTPMFDGMKLILKFGLLILNIELLYLFSITLVSLIFNYGMFFMMPLSNIILINMNYNHFMLLSLHTMLAVINTFLVGCFIINTCFVYLATMRTILFSMMGEFCILMVFMYMININFMAMLNFTMLNVFNIIMWNALHFPIFLMLLMIIVMYLQNLINMFEFSEAESELVAGTMTEFSGMFFCVSSLIELAHMILSTYLMVSLLTGGFYFNMKFMLCMMLIFLTPKLLLCRLKMNNALLFLFFYVFNYLFMYLLCLNGTKLMLLTMN